MRDTCPWVMEENESTKPDIIVDGRNVAGFGRDKTNEWNWDYVTQCAKYYHDKDHKVFVVIPNWIPKDVVEKIKPYTFEIQRVNTNRNKEWDDHMVLALSLMMNGFYVSLDKKMYKHSKGDIVDRTWFAERRIDYSFQDGVFYPGYSSKWNEMMTPEHVEEVRV